MKNSIKILLLISCFSFYNVNAMMESVEVFDGEEFTQAEKDAQAAEDAATEELKKAEAAEEAAKTAAEKQSAQDLLDKAAADKAAADAQMAKAEAAITAAKKEVGTVGTGGGVTMGLDSNGEVWEEIPLDDDIVKTAEVSLEKPLDPDLQEMFEDPETKINKDSSKADIQSTLDAIKEVVNNKNLSPLEALVQFFEALGDLLTEISIAMEEALAADPFWKASINTEAGDQIKILDAVIADPTTLTLEVAEELLNLPEGYNLTDIENAESGEVARYKAIATCIGESSIIDPINEAFKLVKDNLNSTGTEVIVDADSIGSGDWGF